MVFIRAFSDIIRLPMPFTDILIITYKEKPPLQTVALILLLNVYFDFNPVADNFIRTVSSFTEFVDGKIGKTVKHFDRL